MIFSIIIHLFILFTFALSSTSIPFTLYASPGYHSSLVVGLPLGAPSPGITTQLIPTLIDLGHINLVVSAACQLASSGHQKRSSTCPAGVSSSGYDYTLSSSAVVAPGFVQDTDYSSGTSFGTNKLKARANQQGFSAFPVHKILERIFISTILSFIMPVAVAEFSKTLPVDVYVQGNDIFLNNMNQQAAAAAAAAPPPAGVFGLLAIPLPIGPPPNPIPPGAQALVASLSAPAILQNPVVQSQDPGQPGPSTAALAAGINAVDDEFGGYFKRDGLNMKRSVTSCSSIMFRNWDVTKFNGNLFWFPVFGAISTQAFWRLVIQSITITLGTASTGAQVKVNANSKAQASTETIQFDTTNTWILLTSARVSNLYSVFGSNYRTPSSTNPYYTYLCTLQFTLTFGFLDIYGVSQLLTLDQRDFYHGLSVDTPGYCVGTIQPLDPAFSQQRMGLNFMKSYYTVLGYDTTLSASQIGLAVSKRIC